MPNLKEYARLALIPVTVFGVSSAACVSDSHPSSVSTSPIPQHLEHVMLENSLIDQHNANAKEILSFIRPDLVGEVVFLPMDIQRLVQDRQLAKTRQVDYVINSRASSLDNNLRFTMESRVNNEDKMLFSKIRTELFDSPQLVKRLEDFIIYQRSKGEYIPPIKLVELIQFLFPNLPSKLDVKSVRVLHGSGELVPAKEATGVFLDGRKFVVRIESNGLLEISIFESTYEKTEEE